MQLSLTAGDRERIEEFLGKRSIATIEELTAQATAWNQRTNHAKTTIEWKFTRKKARLKLKYKKMRS